MKLLHVVVHALKLDKEEEPKTPSQHTQKSFKEDSAEKTPGNKTPSQHTQKSFKEGDLVTIDELGFEGMAVENQGEIIAQVGPKYVYGFSNNTYKDATR